MIIIHVYAVAAGGIFSVSALIHLFSKIMPLVIYISLRFSKHITYPYLLHRHRNLGPWSRAGVLIQLIYTAGNLFCASFRASTISDAGLRAGSLAVVDMVPLFAGAHLAFFVDRLGISLRAVLLVHRCTGLMAFSLGLFHVLVIAASNVPIPLNEPRNLFAVIVCIAFLIRRPLTKNCIGRIAALPSRTACVPSFS